MQYTLTLKLKYIKLEVHVVSDKMLLYFSQKFKISHSTGCLGVQFGNHGDMVSILLVFMFDRGKS